MVTSFFISLKCIFSGNSCQNWTILEHNVPLYGVSIWSSRIIDPGLMTLLMTSSRIIIIDTKRATSQTSLPVSFTEVLASFKRCALLRYLHRLILASEPCRLPACFFKILLQRQFLSEMDDTLTQCSPIWFVYMVLTYNRSGSDDVTDDVITHNHCRNFGAKYLGNEAR